MRVILAFALAPLATGAILFLASLFTGKPNEGIWAFGLAALIAYPIVLLVGLPIYLVFKRMEWTGLGQYLSAGVLLSIVPILALVIWPKVSSSQAARSIEIHPANLTQSAIILLATLATVASFWFIARPDQA